MSKKSSNYASESYDRYKAEQEQRRQGIRPVSASASSAQSTSYAQTKYKDWLAGRGSVSAHNDASVVRLSEKITQKKLNDLGTRGEALYSDAAKFANSADTSRDHWEYRDYIERVNAYQNDLANAQKLYGDNSTANEYLSSLSADFGKLSDVLYGQKDALSTLPTGVSDRQSMNPPTYDEAMRNWRIAQGKEQIKNNGDWSALVADAPVYGPTLPEEAEPGKSSMKEKTDEVETKLSGLKADALSRIASTSNDKSVISAAVRERTRKTNDAVRERVEPFLEKADYAIEMAGAGVMRQPENIRALVNDLPALAGGRGDEYANAYAAIDSAAKTDPEMSALVNTVVRGGGSERTAMSILAQELGVPFDAVESYAIHASPEYLRQLIYDKYPGISDSDKEKIGDIAYQLGDQYFTIMMSNILSYGLGLAPTPGNGLVNKLAVGAETGIKSASAAGSNVVAGAVKGIGSSAKGAVKDALVGSLKMPTMWASVASDAAFQELRKSGYNPQAYTNAFLQGFGEVFTENLFGLDGTSLGTAIETMSTSVGKNLVKSIIQYAISGVEEGLEEVLNVPIGGLFEKMTIDADKPVFGDGGIFDVKEMWENGLSGSQMGLILGGMTTVVALGSSRSTALNIRDQAIILNATAESMPEAYRPATISPDTATSAEIETLKASITDGYKRYMEDCEDSVSSVIDRVYRMLGMETTKEDALKLVRAYTDLGYGEKGIDTFILNAPGKESVEFSRWHTGRSSSATRKNSKITADPFSEAVPNDMSIDEYIVSFDALYRAGVMGDDSALSRISRIPENIALDIFNAGVDDSTSESVRQAVLDRNAVTVEEASEQTVPAEDASSQPVELAQNDSTPKAVNDTAEPIGAKTVKEERGETAENENQNKGSLDSTDLFERVSSAISTEAKTAISGAFNIYRNSGGKMTATDFGSAADTVYSLAKDLGKSKVVKDSVLSSVSDERAKIALSAVFDQGASERKLSPAPKTRKSTGSVRSATAEELSTHKITNSRPADLSSDKRVAAEVKALRKIGEKIGVDFVIYESMEDADGVRSADNGLYDPNTNTVYLDIHAGITWNESMLRTAGHELTHFIQKWSPEKYEVLRQLVVDRYIGKNKLLLDRRVAEKITEYADKGIKLTTDTAIDEMVADACEMMLKDPDAFSWISAEDKTLAEKIKEWVNDFVQAIKEAFTGVESLSRESRDMLDDMDALQKAWNEGIQSAGKRSVSAKVELTSTQKSQAESNDFGIVVQDGAAVSAPVAEIMRSPDYQPPVDPVGEAMKQSIRTEPAWAKSYLDYYGNSEERQKVVDALNRFTDNMIMDREIVDFVPSGEYAYTTTGPIRKNQEYHVTIDMDASCPRTFQFAAYRDRIQKLGNRMLTYKESINLLELMRAYGQMIPCSYCYLENKRVLLSGAYNNFFNYRQNVINAKTDAEARELMYSYKKGILSDPAQAALKRWRTVEKDYNPSVEEVWSASATSRNSVLNYLDGLYSDGLIGKDSSQTKVLDQVFNHFSVDRSYRGAMAEIKNFVADWFYDTLAEIPHVYQIENDRSVKSIDQKALNLNHEALGYAKSVSSARNVDKYIPYTDQIKNIPPDVKKFINAMGGIRKHSSNDFRLDYVQDYFMIFADLAAEGYFGHTYTKNIDYAKIFGRTGDRINMSIAMVDNKDGTVGMNLQEGADWNEVKALVKNYQDVGAMAMVTSNNQLAFALNSDWITMIIPFHASSLDKAVWYNLRAWFDYTSKQNERPYNASDMKKALRSRGVSFPKNAKASVIAELYENEFHPKRIYASDGKVIRPHFFPDDTIVNGQTVPGHHNDAKRYFELCREYAVHPRFDGTMIPDGNGGEMNVIDHPGYVKLIKETSRTDTPQHAIQFNFDEYDPYLEMTPFEYAMKRMKEEAKNGGYGNVQQDAFGIVDEFMSQYFGKNRPIGYLTERAKNAAEVMEEMRDNQLKFDVSGNEVRHSVRNTEKAELAKENRALRSKLRSLSKQLEKAKAQTKLSDREAVREADLKRLASVYINEYGLDMKRSELVEKIRGIASAVVRDPAWDSAINAAEPVARSIIDSLDTADIEEDVDQAVEELANILIEDVTNNIRYIEKTFADKQSEKVSELKAELKDANNDLKNRTKELTTLERKIEDIQRRFLASDMEKGTQLYEERKEAEATIKDLSSWIKKQEKKITRLERELTKAERNVQLKADSLSRMTQKYETLQQRRKNEIDTAKKNRVISSISKTVNELDNMTRNWSDKAHIPEYLRPAISELVSWFAPSSRVFGKNVNEVMNAYIRILKDTDSNLFASYDADIIDSLSDLAETISNHGDSARLIDFSLFELEEIDDIVNSFSNLVKTANSVFYKGKRADASILSRAIVDEMRAMGDKRIGIFSDGDVGNLMMSNVTPYYFFKHSGDTLRGLYEELMEGQRTYGRETQKAHRKLREIMEKYHYDDWSEANKPYREKTKLTMTTEDGKDISVTVEEALSLYATWKREKQSAEMETNHLSGGGFVTERSVKTVKGKGGKVKSIEIRNAEPITMTIKDMEKLVSMIDKEKLQYADAMVRYISSDMSDLGNEISMELHGYKKFREKYYFPYDTQEAYLATRLDQPNGVAMIKNVGWSKRTKRNANSPLIIRGFTDTVANHVAGMINYYSEAIPQDTFLRILNFKFSKAERDALGLGTISTTKQSIETALGTSGVHYIEQLLRDMFSGVHNSTDITNKLLSSFKKNATALSLSVIIQQYSSIVRANALIPLKYFLQKPPTKTTYNELLRWSGAAAIKDIGSFDISTSRSTAHWLVAPDKAGKRIKSGTLLSTVDELSAFAPQMADKAAWLQIWSACKAEVADKTKLTGDALLAAAGKWFDEVINATQVYDSVLSKSEIMRRKDLGAKLFTSFLAESTVSSNLLMDGVLGKGVKKSYRARAVSSFVLSGVFNAILKSFVQALRNSDDKDKDYFERYAAALMSDLLGSPISIGETRIYGIGSELSPLTMMPVIRDFIEIMQGYDVERSDMSPISDLWKSVERISSKDTTAEDTIQNIVNILSYVSNIPAKNVYRDVEGIVRECLNPHNRDKSRSWQTVWDAVSEEMGFHGSRKEQYSDVIAGWINGKDMEDDIDRIMRTVDNDDALSGFKTAIKNAYLDGKIDSGTSVEYLNRLGISGKGEKSPEAVVSSWDHEKEKDWSYYQPLYDAFDAGENVDEIVRTFSETYNVGESSVRSAIVSHISDRFLAHKITEDEAKELLISAGKDPDATGTNSLNAIIDRWQLENESSVYDSLFYYMEKGDGVRKEISRFKKEYGSTVSGLKRTVSTHYKEEYISASRERRTEIQKMMYSTGLWDSADDVRETCNGWLAK